MENYFICHLLGIYLKQDIPSHVKNGTVSMVTNKGIFGIRLGFLMTEPIRKKYHANDKADDIPKGTVGLKKVRLKSCALH